MGTLLLAATLMFPTLRGENLEGRAFTLPRDLEGEAILLLVAFKREQQAEINTWFSAADTLEKRCDGFRYYEIPTISRGYRWMRFIIDGGMRSGIEDLEQRRRTITVYTDTEAFRDSLGIEGPDAIHALLLDSSGHVRWRAEGPLLGARADTLRAAVRALIDCPAGP